MDGQKERPRERDARMVRVVVGTKSQKLEKEKFHSAFYIQIVRYKLNIFARLSSSNHCHLMVYTA